MKTSDWQMIALFTQYVALTIVVAFEGKIGPVFYWLGAALIITGAFFMKRGM